jgi:hypothetical protein
MLSPWTSRPSQTGCYSRSSTWRGGYDADRAQQVYTQILDRVRDLPGVADAAQVFIARSAVGGRGQISNCPRR